jgi:hypothetical protein
MAFSYDSSLSTTKDKLRFLVQDTVDTGHFLEDAEIEFVAGDEPNLYRAAATLCRTIAAHILKDPQYQDKGVNWEPQEKAAEYRQLAMQHDKKAEQSAGTTVSAASMLANIRPVESYSSGEPTFTRDLHLTDQPPADEEQ